MSGVPSRRETRLVRLLVLVAIAALFASCASRRFAHWTKLEIYPDPNPSPCHAGPGDPVPNPTKPELPIVCIDDRNMSGLIEVPEVIAKRHAVITWFTVTGTGSISVSFDAESPVKHLICGPNKAFCQAVIDSQAPPGKYRYSVLVSSGNRKQTIDPIVDVDPGMVTWDTYK